MRPVRRTTPLAPFAVERSGEIESTQMEEGDEAPALDCLPVARSGERV